MNYRVEYRVLNAADYGAATSRRRLFILARKGRKRIRWPEPTHAKDSKDLFGNLKPWRAAREIIDWSIPGQSIFSRAKPLARTTLLRIEAGLKRYGGSLAPIFISALRAYMNGKTRGEPVEINLEDPAAAAFVEVLNQNTVPKPVDGPVPTITAGGNHMALVEPEVFVLQQQSGGAPRSVDQPLPTVAGKGAQSIVEPKAYIVPGYGERDGQEPRTHDVEKPLPTIPCSSKFGLVKPEAFVLPQNSSNRPRSTEDPMPVITTTSRGIGIVDPIIVQTDQTGSSGKCVRSVKEPVPTLHTKNNLIVVEPIVVGAGGPTGAGKPQSVNEPLKTVLTENHKMLVQPVVVQVNHGEVDMTRRSHSVESPLPTICAPPGMAIAEPCLVEVNHAGGDSGRLQSVEEPVKAVTTKNGKGIVEPVITKYYSNGDGKYGQSVNEPLDTVTTKGRFALAEPVVTRIGIDIRFRMFRVHELARAMGFEKYHFTGTLEEQTKQVGNAVEVHQAKALVRALLEE